MTRRLLNFLTLLSLLLCLASCAVWVRGRWATDYVWLSYRQGGTDTLSWSQGYFRVRHSTWPSEAGFGSVGHDVGSARAWYCRRPPGTLHANPFQGSYRQHGRWGVFSWAWTWARPATDAELQRVADATQAVADAEAAAQAARDDPGLPEPAEPRLEELRRLEVVGRLQVVKLRHTQWEVVFPAWLVAALAAVLPACLLVARRRARVARSRRAARRCAQCAYDLTGNVSGTCPECGTAVAKS